MKECTKKRLLDELDAAIDRAFAPKLKAWEAKGIEVERKVSFDPEESGRHIASVDFYLSKDHVNLATDWARFVYVRQKRGEPAYWYWEKGLGD